MDKDTKNQIMDLADRLCCGGFHHPARSFSSSQNRIRRHTQENRIHKELQNAQHHNHIYNNTFINAHN